MLGEKIMATEEKKELNIDKTELAKKDKKELEAQREELKESFKKVFYRTTAGEFKMPFNLAWKNFEILSEHRGGVSARETEKITSFCKLIRKEYFKSKGLDILIMDNNGNPRLSMTLEENPHFLRENPILAENVDIKNALENRIIEQKMRDLMLAESMEDFFNKLGLLDEEEKNGIFQKILNENLKITKEEKEELDRISQAAKERPLTEEEKEIVYNNIMKIGAKESSEKMANKQELNPEDKLKIFDYATQFIYSDSEEEKREMIILLSSVMSKKEIDQFKASPSLFYKYVLSRINSLTDGSYSSIKEFKEARKKAAIEAYEKENENSTNLLIEETDVDIDLDLFEKNKGYFRMNERNIKSKLKSPMEKRIFATLKDIDFSRDENVLMFVKLYLDCKDENVFLNDSLKNGYSFKRDSSQIDKLNSIRNVLEAVILSRENAGVFGDYIDVNSNGERVINAEKVKENIENIKKSYKNIRSDVISYIVRKDEIEKLNLGKSFDRAEKQIDSEKIQEDGLLSQYQNKKKMYDESKDERAKKEINLELLEIERKLMKVKDYTLFFISGRFDYDAFQKHLEKQSELEQNRDEKFENIIKEFSKVSYRKFLATDQNYEKTDVVRRKEAFSEIYPGEDFDKYNKLYEQYIENLSEKTAIENVYRPFLKGRKLDDMTDIKKDRFMSSLGYLYVSENPEIRKFAEEMIKYTFPNIKCNEDGSVDKKEFDAIYTSFQREGKGLNSAKESFERKVAVPLSKKEKIDFSKMDIEIDLKKINHHMEHINEEQRKRKPRKLSYIYDDEEMKTIEKVEDLDLSDSSNVDAIVMILNRLENEGKRLGVEYNALRSFVFSTQNRRFFAKYIDKSRLKTEDIPFVADPDTVNIELIEKFGLEDKIEIGKASVIQANFEEEIQYQEVKNVLDLVYRFGNEPETLKKSLKRIALLDNDALNIFKKGNRLDTERLGELHNRISEYVEDDKLRGELVAVIAQNFITEDALRDYESNFDGFIEESYKVIRDISEKARPITKEEREAAYNERIEKTKEEREITWEEYLASRPEGTEEDLRRLEEREALRKQREEQTQEPKLETQEVDLQEPIRDSEFSKLMEEREDLVSDLVVSTTKEGERKIADEPDFQSDNFREDGTIVVEDIKTDAVENEKSLVVQEKGNPLFNLVKKAFNAFKKAFKAREVEKEEPAVATVKERPRQSSFDERYVVNINQANYHAKTSSEKPKVQVEVAQENDGEELSQG